MTNPPIMEWEYNFLIFAEVFVFVLGCMIGMFLVWLIGALILHGLRTWRDNRRCERAVAEWCAAVERRRQREGGER